MQPGWLVHDTVTASKGPWELCLPKRIKDLTCVLQPESRKSSTSDNRIFPLCQYIVKTQVPLWDYLPAKLLPATNCDGWLVVNFMSIANCTKETIPPWQYNRHKTMPTSGPVDLPWCWLVARKIRLHCSWPLPASSLTGTVLTCKQELHLLYSWMLSSFTAWMSLSCAIRAWTFVRPSRPVISIFSIICCCLSIQYSQFSNTVSPTGCKILESSKTIRLAPAEIKE